MTLSYLSPEEGRLEAPPASSKKQINDNQRKNQTKTAATVVAKAGAHIVTAAAE
jgi:hypothetical protein